MFKKGLLHQQQGFTLVEVLVAILIATIFVTVAMQMMAIAAVFRVRAQEYAEATTWIQEDLDTVKYEADTLKLASTHLTANVGSTATELTVASIDGFQAGDNLVVGTDSASNTIQSINPATNTIFLDSELATDWLANTAVIATSPRCNSAVSRKEGFADQLRDIVSNSSLDTDENPVTTPLRSKVFKNKTYQLERTTTLANYPPYNRLEINYHIRPTDSFGGTVSGNPIASFYTEVIPYAASQCP